jgi:uncharacterized membrane protein
MWGKLRKCYPPQLEWISLILILVSLYIALSNYSALPDSIPIHFDIGGVPDEWGGKNRISIFPSMAVFIGLLFTFLNFLLAVVKDPKQYINLPWNWKEGMTEEQTEQLRINMNRSLFVLKLLIEGMAVYGTCVTVELAQGVATGTGAIWQFFTMAILALCAFMLWKSYQITGS